jgi:hypothetical protein
MTAQAVYQKSPLINIAAEADLVLNTQGETLASSSIYSIYPTTVPPLTATITSTTDSSILLTISGGADSTAYGITLEAVSSLGITYTSSVVVGVQSSSFTDLPKVDPKGYQTLLGTLDAGGTAVASTVFILDSGYTENSLQEGAVKWEILSSDGLVMSSGDAFEYTPYIDSFMSRVQISALVNVPSTTFPTSAGVAYQLRWTLNLTGYSPIVQSEGITITGDTNVPLGSLDAVEVFGDPINLSVVTDRVYDTVSASIYDKNTKLIEIVATVAPDRVASGYQYKLVIEDTSVLNGIPASMDSYTVIWKYSNKSRAFEINRTTSMLFVTSPTILSAVDYCRMQVSKARTTLLQEDDLLFDTPTILAWLRRGKDDFNAAGGYITTFSMLNAAGAIRSYWLQYSEIAMLRAQSLAEGEKAFNFSGQAISLDVDRSQYYDKLADALQQQVDSQIRPFKAGLQMRGMFGGDGNMDAGIGSNRPSLGVTITPATMPLYGIRYGNAR